MAAKKGKRRLWIIVAAAVVVALILVNYRPESGAGGPCLVKVTANKAPVRSGPNTNDSVGTLPEGLVIQADRPTSNGFRQVARNLWVAERDLDRLTLSNCAAESR